MRNFKKTHRDYKLIVLGEGSERKNLERLIAELNLEDAVSLPEISGAWWEQAKRFQMSVLSSNYEGMSNSLIEAMCIGASCISTKVCGSVDLIQDGKNGYLVDVGDIDAFCTCMNMLASDKELSMSFSHNSAKLYEELNSKAISAQWMSYINEMI